MPHGAPIFVQARSDGSLQPFYEGVFHAVAGGFGRSLSGRGLFPVEIETFKRASGQVFAPEFMPQGLMFTGDKNNNYRQVAEIWGEYPDIITPPSGSALIEKLLCSVIPSTGVTDKKSRLILDSNGTSDFAQLASFILLPRISANATGSTGGGQQICQWNLTPSVTAKHIIAVFGTGYSLVAGIQVWFTVYVNGAGLDSGFYTYGAANTRATPLPVITKTQVLAANVTIPIQVLAGPNFATQASGYDQFVGIMIPTT